ncbi:MAG: hypothetical protein AAB486_04260 [Patescibacteria group bacterium]
MDDRRWMIEDGKKGMEITGTDERIIGKSKIRANLKRRKKWPH